MLSSRLLLGAAAGSSRAAAAAAAASRPTVASLSALRAAPIVSLAPARFSSSGSSSGSPGPSGSSGPGPSGSGRPKFQQNHPKFRTFVYTFLFSSALLVFVSSQVDRKPPPKTNFTEEEFEEYENSTHLRRRHKVVAREAAEAVKFYALPYVHAASVLDKVAANIKQAADKPVIVKVVDPQQLIEAEKHDTSRKYSYLLQELEATRKPLSKGLVTALIKEHVREYIESEDFKINLPATTAFLLKNYPQNTDDAIKFENDVADIKKCVSFHYDMLNELPKQGAEFARSVNNVVGYFDTVGKATSITTKFDAMDRKLEEIVLKDI